MGLADWDAYFEMVHKVTSTGMYALIGTLPHHKVSEEKYKDWYRSTETISGTFPYIVHLSNKKTAQEKNGYRYKSVKGTFLIHFLFS